MELYFVITVPSLKHNDRITFATPLLWSFRFKIFTSATQKRAEWVYKLVSALRAAAVGVQCYSDTDWWCPSLHWRPVLRRSSPSAACTRHH